MYNKDIDFENDFKKERESNFNGDENNKTRYIVTIALYISLFTLGLLSLIYLGIFRAFPGESFFRKPSDVNASLDKSSLEVNNLTIINGSDYNNASKDLTVLFKIIYHKDNYVFLIHKDATGLVSDSDSGYMFLKDGAIYLKDEVVNDIISGRKTKWENNLDINIITPKSDVASFLSQTLDITKVDAKTTMTPLVNALILTLTYISMAAILYFALAPQIIYDFKNLNAQGELPKRISSAFVTALLISLVFNFGAQLVGIIIGNANQTSINQLSINNLLATPVPAFISLTAIVVFGPFVEELVFRKSIMGLIKDDKIAIAVSTIVFAMIHISAELISGEFSNFFINLISYAGGGVAFGYIYVKSNRNIWLSIYVHMLYNLFTVIMSIFA